MIVNWAERLSAVSGEMLLLAPSEKLKRQIGIFGSLDHMLVAKSTDPTTAKRLIPSPEEPQASESLELDESPGF